MSPQSWGMRGCREGNQIGVPPTLIPYKPPALHPAALSVLILAPSRAPPRTTEQMPRAAGTFFCSRLPGRSRLPTSLPRDASGQALPRVRGVWAPSPRLQETQGSRAGGLVSHGLGAASVSQAPFPLTRCLHVDLCTSFAFLLFLRKMG